MELEHPLKESAEIERHGVEDLRVVDLHPWTAEPVEAAVENDVVTRRARPPQVASG